MNQFFRRLEYLWNRRRYDQELANDLEFHREMAAREGRSFGPTLHLREESREAWGWTWIDRASQDLRYAGRMLRRSPAFTAAAILILAVGIGVNVAAFGFFNLMVLRPLPVRDPATLVRFQRSSSTAYASVLPYPEMTFFRENARTLSAVLAWTPASLTLDGQERTIRTQFVTANFFAELGAVPALGRLLAPSRDDTPGAEPVVVLSYGFWERQFGANPSIAGTTIHLNGKPVMVAGVAPAGFSGLSLEGPAAWLHITQQPYFVPGSRLLTDYSVEGSGVTVWGRLQPGATPKVAEAELRSLAAALRPQHPGDIWEGETLPAGPGAYATTAINHSHHGTGAQDPDKLAPMAAVIGALVLLILAVACGNLGGLLLARGVARDREISIRVAVGAGRGRLIRQLFTESLVLALLGAAAGLVLGEIVLRGLMSLTDTPPWLNPAPDWRVLLFTLGIGFAAAILFGLTPALQLARGRHRATVLRQTLIAAQVAASCVLLIVAGLLTRALNQASADPGFEYRQVIAIHPALDSHGYSPANARAYFDTLESRLRALPGVEAVAFASNPPFGAKTTTIGTEFRGHPVSIHVNSIDPRYFQTLAISLLHGRNFQPGDFRAVILSRSVAALAWPGEDPLGKIFEVGDSKYSVIGISANARSSAPEDRDTAEAYFLAKDADLPGCVALVRTAGAPEAVAPGLTSIAKAIDPKVLPDVQLMKRSFERSLQGTRYSALSVGLLAFVALLLACLGIVGLVAYAVSQRSKEIGIRMALGARPAQVLAVVLRQFARPVLAGLLVGLAGAAALSQILRRVLYGIGSLDPVAYLGAIAFFAVTAALATWLPARRALRIDPMRALRND